MLFVVDMVKSNKIAGVEFAVEIRVIEYCTTNIEQDVLTAIDELRKLYPQAKIQEWGCLGHCHYCFRHPFVYLNERVIIEAKSASELVMLVQKAAAE